MFIYQVFHLSLMFISLLLDQTTSTSLIWFALSPPCGMLRAFIPLSHFVSQRVCPIQAPPFSLSHVCGLWGQISMPKDDAAHVAVSVVAEAGKGSGKDSQGVAALTGGL